MKNKEEKFLNNITMKLMAINEKIDRDIEKSGHGDVTPEARELKKEVMEMLKSIEDRKKEVNSWRLGYL